MEPWMALDAHKWKKVPVNGKKVAVSGKKWSINGFHMKTTKNSAR